MASAFDDDATRPRQRTQGISRQLQESLARHLREAGWLTFTEILVPGTGDSSSRWEAGRVDVAAVKPHHYARKDLRAYEVKSTRSDFLRDTSSNKWQRYLQVFHRVYFAAPAGLIQKSDLPEGAGLIVKSDKGWRTIVAARSHTPPQLTADSILALLFRGYEEHRVARDLRTRLIFKDGEIERARNFGHEVGRRLAEVDHELAEPLVRLQAIVEQALGVSLQTPAEIRSEEWRMEHLLRELAEFRGHSQIVQLIAGYLSRLGSTYGVDEAREQIAVKLGDERVP